MRHCGSVETVQSYERISRRDGNYPAIMESRRFEKLGGKYVEDNSQAHISNKPRSASARFQPKKVAESLGKAKKEMSKIGLVDILLGYHALIQASVGANINQLHPNRDQLHPTVGFVRNP